MINALKRMLGWPETQPQLRPDPEHVAWQIGRWEDNLAKAETQTDIDIATGSLAYWRKVRDSE